MHKKLVKKGQWGMEISSPLGTLYPGMSPFRKPQYEQVNSWFQTDKIVPQQHLYSMPNNYKDKLPDVNELSNFLVSNILGNNTDISNTGTPTIRSSSITPTFDPTLLQKFSASTFGKNFNQWNSGLNMASNAVTALFGNKSEYDGDKGYVAQGLDGAYDTVQNYASTLGPAGQLVSLGMGVNKLVGNVANKLGAGTDGMCVCAGTKVFKANGEIVNIEDLKQEDGIIGWNEETKQIVPQTIHNIIEPRQKECLEITTKSGFTLRCSIDHPILSDNSPKAKSHRINGQRIAYRDWKFRRADQLKVGDFIGVANSINYWGNSTLDKAYLIGLLIGDGTYTKGSSCKLISADKSTWDYIESNNLGVINHCDDSIPDKYNTEVRTYRIIDGMDLMRQVGLVYQSGQNKTLPKNIGQFTKDSVCQLLAGLYDTDGSISVNEDKNNWSITLYQSNKNLLQEVKEQLHKLGIFAIINTRKASQYQLGGRIINSNQSYRLEVSDIASAIKFTQLIPLNIDYKKSNLIRIHNLLKDKKAQEHPELSGAKQFKIIDIKPIGLQTVYNLQADSDHTYLANGIITHNTTTDAVLGSSFLAPIGIINGAFGKRADTITKDNQAFQQVGSSYGGTMATVNDALEKSGKKYGLLSSGSRHAANRQINEAKQQQSIMSDIADLAYDRFAIQGSTAAINENRRNYYMTGGYDQDSVHFGRNGMSMELMKKAKEINAKINNKQNDVPQHKNGGTFIELTHLPTEICLVNPIDVPEFQKGGQVTPKTRTLQELIDYAKEVNPRFIQRMSEPLKYVEWDDENGHHFGTHELGYSEMDGRYFVYPNIQEDSNGNLVRYPKDKWEEAVHNAYKNKNGLFFNTEEEAKIFTESQENPDGTFSGYKSGWPDFFKQKPTGKYQNGGSINVIPDGALHARKHNMDMDGITKKGIPVVSEGENGHIEQQAEIEKEEIIFRLEVTKQLEEMERKYYNNDTSNKEKDELALKAGQLLVKEILYNTQDNTQALL